jgi:hypothetical protein
MPRFRHAGKSRHPWFEAAGVFLDPGFHRGDGIDVFYKSEESWRISAGHLNGGIGVHHHFAAVHVRGR